MRFIQNPSHRVVAVYAACGLAIGFIFLPLIPLVRILGLPRDSSVGIAIFGLMPLLLIVLGLSYPRFLINLLGLIVAMLSWALGYAVASLLMGFGSSCIVFSLVIMAPLVLPAYFILTLLVFVLANSWRPSRHGA